MRTAKCIAVLGVVALAGLLAAAAQTGPGGPQAQKEPSNTRAADCLVRITADPVIIPLNPETVTDLLYSSGVLGEAAKDILGPDAPRDPRQLVSIQWLPEMTHGVGTRIPASSDEEADREMMRQFEDVYGKEYRKMLDTVMRDGQDAPKERDGQDGVESAPPVYEDPYGGPTGPYGGGIRSPYEDSGVYGGVLGGTEIDQAMNQGVTFRLSVRTPDGVRPVAREFLIALVANLRESLTDAYGQYAKSLDELRVFAMSQREDVEKRLGRAAGDSSSDEMRIKEQLDTIIDLSGLTAQTPLREAIEMLKNSVQPPLPIVVQWNSLESVNITPDDPAGIDGLPSIKVGTALDLLVKGYDRLGYGIQGGVIAVAPGYSLRESPAPATQPKTQSDVRTLSVRKNELAREVQSLDLGLAGMEARRQAIQEQMARAEHEANDRLANDAVTQELEKLVQLSTTQFERLKQLADTGRLSQTELAQGQESMARARVELARRREELTKQVSGSRLEQFNNELSRMAIDKAEKQTQLEILSKQLGEVQGQLAQAATFDPGAARTRIAQETMDTINRRIGELESRLATLQPPTVVMIGAN